MPAGLDTARRTAARVAAVRAPYPGTDALSPRAAAWLENGGTPATAGRVVQECQAGLVPVLRSHDPAGGADTPSSAAPPTVRTGPLEEEYLQQVVAAFGIDRSQVLDHRWVDDGPGWAVVQLPTAADVLAPEPDLSRRCWGTRLGPGCARTPRRRPPCPT